MEWCIAHSILVQDQNVIRAHILVHVWLTCVFTRVFARAGAPRGGVGGSRRREMKEVEPIVAARCKGHWLALSRAFIYKEESLD